mgnify:CR=1 FL=1
MEANEALKESRGIASITTVDQYLQIVFNITTQTRKRLTGRAYVCDARDMLHGFVADDNQPV